MEQHELCGRVHTSPAAQFFCAAARSYYGTVSRKPRRTKEEAVLAKVAKAKAISARREFNAIKRAEREARKRGSSLPGSTQTLQDDRIGGQMVGNGL